MLRWRSQNYPDKTMTRRTIALLVSLCAIFATPGYSGDERPGAEQLRAHPAFQGALSVIDAWVDGVRDYDRVPGMSVGIFYDRELLWDRGYGYSNLESQRPADADTIYSICSISKLFTAIGVMQLRDAGKLRLDDPVSDHLDWFDIEQAHPEGGPATIEGLLTHSSGLPRESDFPYWNAPDFPFPTRESMIARIAEQQTLYPASTYYQYSNLALSLAGEIIQERSGTDYQAYMKKEILDPLGMEDTRTFYPEDLRGEQLAIGYTGLDRSGERDPVKPFFTRGITAAAGFTSTVRDLARFGIWQFATLDGDGNEILDRNTLREMHRVHWISTDWETTRGLGFGVIRDEDETYVGHSGGCPGYITQFLIMPEHRLGAIALTNAGDGPATRTVMNMLKVIKPAIDAAHEPPEDEIPDYSIYEGNYEFPPWGGEIAVRQNGEHLVVIDLPSDDLTDAMTLLKHRGGNVFVRLTDKGEERDPWEFHMGPDGTPEKIVAHSHEMHRIR